MTAMPITDKTDSRNPGRTVETSREEMLALISQQQKQFDERMTSLQRQFDERITAIQEAATASNVAQKEAVTAAQLAAEKAVGAALAAQKEGTASALAASDRAVSKAEIATEKRFESVNEFRNQLGDQARTFMPRTEAEVLVQSRYDRLAVMIKAMDDRLTTMEARVDKAEGKSGGAAMTVAYVSAGISIIIALITILSRFIK